MIRPTHRPRPAAAWLRTLVAASVLCALPLAGCSGDTPATLLASARASLAKNDDRTAVIQVKNALQAQPDSAEARYLLGVALLRGGQWDDALVELHKAETLKWSRDEVVPRIAEALLLQGKARQILADDATVRLPDAKANADLLTTVAYARAMQGDNDGARQSIAAALAADPGFVPAQIAHTRFIASSGDADAALASADAILGKNPRNAEALRVRGDILVYLKSQPEAALADYRKAIEVDPGFAPAHLAILTILTEQRKMDDARRQLAALRKVTGATLQTVYIEAMIDYTTGEFDKAHALTQQLLKAAPESPSILLLAGGVELQSGSLVQAETYLQHAVQLAPDGVVARHLLVTTALRANEPDKALAALRPAGSREPIPPSMYDVAAETYLQNGDIATAETYYEKAAQQNPTNAQARTSLALAHLVNGKAPMAFGELQQIAASDKGTGADMALVSVYAKQRDYAKALTAVDAIDRKQPDQPMTAGLRGNLQLAMNDTAGARKSFGRALALSPSYFPAVASLAKMDVAQGRPQDAGQRLQDFLKANPNSSQALMALAVVPGTNSAQAVDYLTRAVALRQGDTAPRLLLVDRYLADGNTGRASQVAQDAVATLPERPDLVEALARAQLAAGDTNQSLATYTHLVELQPNSALPYLRLADVQLQAGNAEAARQSLRKSLELAPDFVDAQRQLVSANVAAGDVAGALALARTVQRQRPDDATGWLLEGDVHGGQHDWRKAAEDYRVALQRQPVSEVAAKVHGALQGAGQDADAGRFGADWMKAHPADAGFLFHLGDSASVRKDYAGATADYLAVVRLQPDNAAAYNNLAWVAGQRNDAGALGYARKAVQLAPDQPAYLDTLAGVLAAGGQVDEAVSLQKKAVALAPRNSDFKLDLARLYLRSGQKDEARTALNQLVDLGPQYTGQAQVATLLKSL